MGSVLLTCLIIAVPFVFGGVVVSLALTRFPDQVNRLYAADLIGAGIGCIGFVVLLRRFDGPSSVVAVGALGALAAIFFARDAGNRTGVIVIAIMLLVPIGLRMGMPFSIGMKTAIAARPDAPTAFLWGINGATSVVASVAGIVLAIFFGIAFTFWMGVLAHCVACGALFVARHRLAGAPVDEPIIDVSVDDRERLSEPVTVDGA